MKAWASDLCLLLLMVAIGYSVDALSLAGIVTPLTLEPAASTSVTYTMPASTLPSSTWVSTDFTSGCSVTGLTVIPAFLNTSAATAPQGTCGWHSATLTDFFARSFTDVTFAGLFGGTATCMVFLTKSCGLDASPAETTSCMFFGDAEAKTSAGAPLVISVARPELGPKLNFTVSPLCAASNCFPICVKAPVSDAAAKTVIVPVAGELLVELGELELLLEQPATATAVNAAMVKAKRRMLTPWLNRDQLVCGISTETLVAFTAATASIPASRPSSSAASRLSKDTNRCGPAWISTWAITVSRITRVTRPLNLLRAEWATTAWLAARSGGSASSWASLASATPSTASRPELSVIVSIRPSSAQRRRVSVLTPSRLDASLIRKVPSHPGTLAQIRLQALVIAVPAPACNR